MPVMSPIRRLSVSYPSVNSIELGRNPTVPGGRLAPATAMLGLPWSAMFSVAVSFVHPRVVSHLARYGGKGSGG
jgi:hypothetical protein